MDVTLAGEINGIEAAKQIKVEYGIPVIIFSGYNDESFLKQAWAVGPVAVLEKMVPFSEILIATEAALER